VKRTLTTSEAALFLGLDPRSFRRWARERGLEPLRTQRIGRSTVTVWCIRQLGETMGARSGSLIT
jgi:hypothetical protein